MAATKKTRARPKKPPKIVTTRPDPADESPVRAWRYGAAVIVDADRLRSVLTPAEAKELAAVLLLQSDLAARTPKTPDGVRQLPDE